MKCILFTTAFMATLFVLGTCTECCPCKPCGRNETYSQCANGGCSGAEYCSEQGAPVKCVKPRRCYQGCVCKEGYLRDDATDKCILENDCPEPCGGDFNAKPGCGTNCGRRCADYIYYQDSGILQACPAICILGGCDCKPGYLYDDVIGKCVSPVDCTKCTGQNEYYELCPPCGPDTCASLGQNVECPIGPAVCKPACRCIGGFYRNEFGNCVPAIECTEGSCNGDPKAVPGCGNPCGNQCKYLGSNESIACIAICYENGCDCKKGYIYDDVTGMCVLPQDCSRYQCNRPHEVYVPCPDCSPQTCETINEKYNCPLILTDNCSGECRCEPGYYRNKIGECIPEGKCLLCNGPHEYFSCGGPCDNVCANLSEQNQTNCPFVNVKCNEQCYCESNYARDENGTCIPIEECPNQPTTKCTGQNEYYELCPPCGPDTCASLGQNVECPIGPAVCKPACRCIGGFYRNEFGNCVPAIECTEGSCNGDPKAVPGCGNPCGNQCKYLGSNESIACTKICYENGCDCKKGYIYDDVTENCVLPQDCSRYHCNQPHEVYASCPGCSPQTCDTLNETYSCVQSTDFCRGACICEAGYYRNKIGECILKENCLLCNGPHEYFSCGGPCDNVCAKLSEQNQTNCPLVNIKCNEQCYCESNYARDENGTCIPIEECPNQPPTEGCNNDPNAIRGCGNPCEKQCKYLGSNESISCIQVCYENGCDCKEGYIYDDVTEMCVLPRDCSRYQCPGPNEYLDKCAPRKSETCDSIGKDIVCPIQPQYCVSACRCKEDYYRNNDGVCVYKLDCPNQPCMNNTNSCNNDYNSEPGCGVNCGKLCSNVNSTGPVACSDICVVNGCDCKSGYYFDYTVGKCVLPEQCGRFNCSKPNEIFDQCLVKCPPRECGVDPSVIRCAKQPEPGDEDCEAGCRCADGFLRNKEGLCVQESDCPDPICDENTEVVDGCINGGCREATKCSEIGRPILCIDPIYCKKGCICKEGYLRDDNSGRCIPQENCPVNNTNSCNGDYNAVRGCGVNCGQLCSNVNSTGPVACSDICVVNGCDCKDGYYFDYIVGKCVLPEQCGRFNCSKPNEIFDQCLVKCPPRECGVNPSLILCAEQPKPGDEECEAGCRCADGFLRNKEGFCVRGSDCPDPICDENTEVLDGCINGGCRGATKCSEIGRPVLCIDLLEGYCEKGCICKEGYLRDDNGCCIPQENCPATIRCTKPNEEFQMCPKGCPPGVCGINDLAVLCAPDSELNCTAPACKCKFGFYRDDKGNCVTFEECPKCDERPNEVYDPCDSPCNPRRCDVDDRLIECGPPPSLGDPNCVAGCRCADGYKRDSNDTCIPQDQCPASCGENEAPDCSNGDCSGATNSSEVGN